MIVDPRSVADRGFWISHDRVYALVSASGIGEVGYHGGQPVSRNSRVFAGSQGAVTFEAPGLRFRSMEWSPSAATLRYEVTGGDLTVDVTAVGRTIRIRGTCSAPVRCSIVFRTDALLTAVHGRRHWEERSRDSGSVMLRFMDTIHLDEWMEREGPYAGDFLIPEPMRRRIFARRCRSGSATREDLLPEFRGSRIPIQEGEVRVRIGGDGYELSEGDELLRFLAPVAGAEGELPPFVVAFDEQIDARPVDAPPVGALPVVAPPAFAQHRREPPRPSLRIQGFPQVERFFETIPSLVDSAVVADPGIPRATPGRYYWIWSWDAMVTAQGALWWGDAGLAAATAAFVDRHRDVDGRIPMQWTRGLEPLDTQDPGALDTLLYALAYATYLEAGDDNPLRDMQPRMVAFLDKITAASDTRGLFAGIGFYPDLPLRFGRTPESAVATEIAAFFTFCRICENVSRLLGDAATAVRAAAAASKIEAAFQQIFWDPARGFLLDAVHPGTGRKNDSYPLFSLLFLHSPLGLPLLRGQIGSAAEFIARNHLTPHGLRLLPSWDLNAAAESVTGSWYPHWDVYALSLLRRAGRSDEIMSWLQSVETALARLGYAPEFLELDGLPSPEAWNRHGAASNLNCVTGWYRSLISGLCGLEQDPGGLTILPLHLPLGELNLTGIRSHGTTWDCHVRTGGPEISSVRVDGRELRGCLKIPARYHDGGHHRIELVYGERSLRAAFAEVANAEILEISDEPAGTGITIRALGSVEVVIRGDHSGGLLLDGRQVVPGPLTGGMVLRLDLDGVHHLQVEERGQ